MKSLILMLVLLSAEVARADSLREQWTPETKLALAHCLVSETNWGPEIEKAAIAHVLVKRWVLVQGYKKTTLLNMIRAYCSIHHRTVQSARKRWILAMPWAGEVPKSCGKSCGRLWREVRIFVNLFSLGIVPDPLPTAMHFGNEEDHRQRYLRGLLGKVQLLPREVATINGIVTLENFFYAIPGIE